MVAKIQPSFAGGELSPSLYARVDLAKFQVGLRRCYNFFVQAWGGVANRPGFQFLAETKQSGKARLIPFQYNTDQAYVLEFGHLYMRVHKASGQVLETAKTITGITNASPAVVTSAAHGFSNGQEVYITGVGGMTELNGRNFQVAGVTANTFQLKQTDGSANINSTSYGTYTSGGTAARVYEIVSPYSFADLALLKFVQSADVMTLTHPSYQQRDLSRSSDTNWSFATPAFAPGVTGPATVTVTPDGGAGTFTYKYAVTAISSDTGEESLPTFGQAINTEELGVTGGADFMDVTWTPAAGYTYAVFREKNGVYGYVGTADGGSFHDDNIEADMADTPPSARNPFSGSGNWPGCATYHAERKFYGRTNNKRQTVFGSKVGAYDNFSVASPAKDDDAVTYTIVSRQVHEIRHLVSLNDLLIFTSGGEWVMKPGGQSDNITPSSVTVKAQSYRGSSDVPPIIVGPTVLYVQDRGQIVRDLGYKFEIDGYAGDDLTLLSRHIFDHGRVIREWAYAQAPHSLIWCALDDGTLATLTYLREHDVFAWSRHATDGVVTSVASIADGDEDAVFAIVRRQVNGRTVRYIEKLHSRRFDDVRDCFFVDSGLSLDAPVLITGITAATPPVVTTSGAHGLVDGDLIDLVEAIGLEDDGSRIDHPANGVRYQVDVLTSTTFRLKDEQTAANINGSSWPAWYERGEIRKAVTTISGLWHLEGREVGGLADGSEFAPQTVANGTITLERPASRVHAGLLYTAEIETLDVDLGNVVGTTQGKRKTVPSCTLRVEDSRGGFIGPNFDTLYEVKALVPAMDQPIALKTGDIAAQVTPAWDEGGRLAIRQSSPLPLTILAVIPDVQVGD